MKKVLCHGGGNQNSWLEEHEHLTKFNLKAHWGWKGAALATMGLGCLGEDLGFANEMYVLVYKTLSNNLVSELMFAYISALSHSS